MSKMIELKKPPVIEVVIGAQFNNPMLDNSLIYNFYQKIKSNYPKIQEQPPLPSIIEYPNKPNLTRILQGFNTRRFFINTNGDRLIQLQSDRLLFNWRKNSETDEYPKFNSVLNGFLEVFNSLNLEIANLPEKLNQFELTFIDHIVLNDLNLQTIRLGDIFNQITFPYDIKNCECNFTFPQETINGNLTLVVRSGINNKNQNKLLVCETTCRGFKSDSESMEEWFNKSHSILLDFFIDLFTEKSKIAWGIKK
jgi:uncharacterized protein (TIGR04255 family)